MTTLNRVTVEYLAHEDRVRISGERAEAPPLAVWLTRRLLDRLVPELLRWVEGEGSDLPAPGQGGTTPGGPEAGPGNLPRAEVLHSFAQHAARAKLAPQAPVSVGADAEAWLAQSVNIAREGRSIRLTFRSAGGQSATLTLATQPLRQWLNILHDTYCRADWPLQVWPDWVREAGAQPQALSAVWH
jgi:hypothetical protein